MGYLRGEQAPLGVAFVNDSPAQEPKCRSVSHKEQGQDETTNEQQITSWRGLFEAAEHGADDSDHHCDFPSNCCYR